jgi:hypothetical protein
MYFQKSRDSDFQELEPPSLSEDQGSIDPVRLRISRRDYEYGYRFADHQRLAQTNAANGFNDMMRDEVTAPNRPL